MANKRGIWRLSGILLAATGGLHIAVGLVMGWEHYVDIVRAGFINAIGMDFVRAFAEWFFMFGVLLLLFGLVLHHYIRRTGEPAPRFVGWWLLVMGIVGAALEPISGYWLVIPQGLIILRAKK